MILEIPKDQNETRILWVGPWLAPSEHLFILGFNISNPENHRAENLH